MTPPAQVDRSALAGRIQGFGNVNPPPLEEDNAKTMVKRVATNLGNMVGEEILLTVEDFKEKGAVGAVKDAVFDAGDLVIDGVSSVFGWIRGDPPPEEDDEKAEAANSVLAHGPRGAAYGVSQASPTGGINAVWVMPEDADPQMLAEVASQSRSAGPSNIQPYAPQGSMQIPGGPAIQPYQPNNPMQIPGGPAIAPYQPQGKSGALGAGAGFVPGSFATSHSRPAGAPSFGTPGFGAPGYGAPGFGAAASSQASSGQNLAKGVVDQVASGQTLPGPEVAKRLVGQCSSARMDGAKLAQLISEKARRLYLGLDGSDPAGTDASLARLLALTDALNTLTDKLAKEAVEKIKDGISEELLSLQSSAKHRQEAEPMLRRLGLLKKAPEMADLLGDAAPTPAAASNSTDLLGGGAQETDLLGGALGAPAAAPSAPGDLLF